MFNPFSSTSKSRLSMGDIIHPDDPDAIRRGGIIYKWGINGKKMAYIRRKKGSKKQQNRLSRPSETDNTVFCKSESEPRTPNTDVSPIGSGCAGGERPEVAHADRRPIEARPNRVETGPEREVKGLRREYNPTPTRPLPSIVSVPTDDPTPRRSPPTNNRARPQTDVSTRSTTLLETETNTEQPYEAVATVLGQAPQLAMNHPQTRGSTATRALSAPRPAPAQANLAVPITEAPPETRTIPAVQKTPVVANASSTNITGVTPAIGKTPASSAVPEKKQSVAAEDNPITMTASNAQVLASISSQAPAQAGGFGKPPAPTRKPAPATTSRPAATTLATEPLSTEADPNDIQKQIRERLALFSQARPKNPFAKTQQQAREKKRAQEQEQEQKEKGDDAEVTSDFDLFEPRSSKPASSLKTNTVPAAETIEPLNTRGSIKNARVFKHKPVPDIGTTPINTHDGVYRSNLVNTSSKEAKYDDLGRLSSRVSSVSEPGVSSLDGTVITDTADLGCQRHVRFGGKKDKGLSELECR